MYQSWILYYWRGPITLPAAVFTWKETDKPNVFIWTLSQFQEV